LVAVLWASSLVALFDEIQRSAKYERTPLVQQLYRLGYKVSGVVLGLKQQARGQVGEGRQIFP